MHRIEVIRFGAFAMVPRRRELLFRGAPVTVGTRAFDLLTALIERRGGLAAKNDLMAEVWGRAIVDDNNLAAQVSALRKVLAADASLRRCLQAIPGQGYRFVADIEIGTEMLVAAREGDARGTRPDALSLVVLPFESLGGERQGTDFAQGLSHTLATDLSRISGLLVIASATAATFAGGSLDVRKASRELDVRHVLTGNLQRIGRRLRINAQLADGRNGVQVWSELFDGEDSDPLTLQDLITGRIANAMGREIFVAAARAGDERNVDPRSFDLLMQGIAADNRPQSLETLREQERLFTRAVDLDPHHADAMARLARAILLQATQLHAPSVEVDILGRGVRAAERAVMLDPGNARTHYAMGLVHVLHRDFARAVLANEAAIALDRNFALAHNNLGNSLVHLGHGSEALDAAQHALRLDPRGPQVAACWTTMGFARLLLGHTEEALDCFSRARVANPKLPRALVGLAVSLGLSGNVPAARGVVGDLLDLNPAYRLSLTMDAAVPMSSPQYRTFYERVLLSGAVLADMPI